MPRHLFTLLLNTLTLFWLMGTSSAQAAYEYWPLITYQYHLPKTQIWEPDAIDSLQLSQLSDEKGLYLMRSALGLQWKPSPGFELVTHANLLYLNVKAPTQEFRLDLQSNFRGRWNPEWTWYNRNTLEWRIFPTRQSLRARILGRFNYQFSTHWGLYTFNEVFVESEKGLNQNRFSMGLMYKASPTQRWDMGYMLRHRIDSSSNWTQDHLLMTALHLKGGHDD